MFNGPRARGPRPSAAFVKKFKPRVNRRDSNFPVLSSPLEHVSGGQYALHLMAAALDVYSCCIEAHPRGVGRRVLPLPNLRRGVPRPIKGRRLPQGITMSLKEGAVSPFHAPGARLAVVGSLNADLFVQVPRLPLPGTPQRAGAPQPDDTMTVCDDEGEMNRP